MRCACPARYGDTSALIRPTGPFQFLTPVIIPPLSGQDGKPFR
jgi:hypothetical protein